MARKKAIRTTAAAVKRHLKQQVKARGVWAKREFRLLGLIGAIKSNKSMQPQAWVDGQVAYYEMLLANHRAAKPK